MEKEGFVYLWYDRKHKRYYLGQHWGTENDGYIGSSTWFKNSYKRRPLDFKRRILKIKIHREELLKEEYKWLQQIKKEELGKRYYNLHNYHFGHWSANPQSVKSMKERNLGPNNPRYGKKHTDEWKEAKRKQMIENNPFKDKTHSEETRQKMSNTRKGVPTGRAWNKGIPTKEETKKKMRQKMSGDKNHFFGKFHSEETKKKISENRKGKLTGSNHPLYGKGIQINTPFGLFSNMMQAARSLNLTKRQVQWRVNSNSEEFKEWSKVSSL